MCDSAGISETLITSGHITLLLVCTLKGNKDDTPFEQWMKCRVAWGCLAHLATSL